MDRVEIRQVLATNPRFTIFEAYSREFQVPVVLKRCLSSKIEEVEFFVRFALMKVKDKVYSQQLLSIFADDDSSTRSIYTYFMWEKGEALDPEVEYDRESLLPQGRAGYDTSQLIYTNYDSDNEIRRFRCLTLDQKVIIKIFNRANILDMNFIFKAALAQARCAHPYICDFLDFRLFMKEDHSYCAYIVMESLKHDLMHEIKVRGLQSQPYSEGELVEILKSVAAGLLAIKSQNFAHGDIKPSHIARGPRNVKLIDFSCAWQKGSFIDTSKITCTPSYMSPEISEAIKHPDAAINLFESDVFSLGMTMLHLAGLKLPDKAGGEVQREVQALPYSDEFKQLLAAMLSAAPRPSLESIKERSANIYRQVFQTVRLEGEYLPAACTVDTSSLPINLDIAQNISHCGCALARKGNNKEALQKFEEAGVIFSTFFPNEIETANNLHDWGNALHDGGNDVEAVKKIKEADKLYHRYHSRHQTTVDSFIRWRDMKMELRKKWALAVSPRTDLDDW